MWLGGLGLEPLELGWGFRVGDGAIGVNIRVISVFWAGVRHVRFGVWGVRFRVRALGGLGYG